VAFTSSRRSNSAGAASNRRFPMPVDQAVASVFAELVATARRAGRRPKVQDIWIAATARAHGVAVYAQDSDFDDLSVNVVHV
jgi:predicted nucleic acid-binding protein